MRPSKQEWAMNLALSTAKRSTCLRRHVGAVLFDDRWRVLSTGYNGVASGMPHCNEEGVQQYPTIGEPVMFPHACKASNSPSGTNLDGCEAIHAEQNAIMQCGDVDKIAVCVSTTSPCMTCTKLLLNTGCQTIIFYEEYPHQDAIFLWRRAGRSWSRLPWSSHLIVPASLLQ